MERSLTKMLSVALVLASLGLISCGSDDDDDSGAGVQQEIPTPEEEVSAENADFNQSCRPANEVQGGNYQFFWSVPRPGEISTVAFDTSSDLVRIDYQAREEEFVSEYQILNPDIREVGANGTLTFAPYSLFFPAIPTGNIRGSRKDYAIGYLENENGVLGPYLCPLSLQDELKTN